MIGFHGKDINEYMIASIIQAVMESNSLDAFKKLLTVHYLMKEFTKDE